MSAIDGKLGLIAGLGSLADDNSLEDATPIERLEALLAAVTRSFHASEWQFDSSARAVVIDEDLP